MTIIRFFFYFFMILTCLTMLTSLGFYTYLFLTDVEPHMSGDSFYE